MIEQEVFSQEELDAIPTDFNGRIIIKFGTPYNRAVVNRAFKYRVVLWGSSSAELWGSSSAVLWDSSSAVLRGSSSAEGRGNAQILNKTGKDNVTVSGNARIVYDPDTVLEYLDYYGMEHKEGIATLYKAVHKRDGRYYSDNDSDFEYKIGEVATADELTLDRDNDCGHGIHMADAAWCVSYGAAWDDLAILEVKAEIDGIVVPKNNPGKVRAEKVQVIREVPLEECGLQGKWIAKRRNQ